MNTLVLILEAVVMTIMGKWLLDKITPNFDDDKAIAEGNKALKIRRLGAFIALFIAMIATLVWRHSGNLVEDAGYVALYGLTSFVFIFIGMKISDWYLSPGFQNNDLIKNDNTAVAIVEAGGMISSAFITFAAIACEGTWLSALFYWLFGMIMLIAGTLIFKKLHGHNFAQSIEVNQNTSVAWYYARFLGAIAYIIMGATYGDSEGHFEGWQYSLKFFLIVGILFALVAIVIHKIMYKNVGFTDAKDSHSELLITNSQIIITIAFALTMTFRYLL